MSPDKLKPVREFRWVRAKDRLPDEGSRVAVSLGSGGTSFMDALYRTEGALRIPGFWSGGFLQPGVTHWSYIPEPVDDSMLLIIDEPDELPQEVIDAFRLGKPPTTNLDHMTAQIGELDDVLFKLLDRVKILEVRRTATPKETRDAAMGVIDRSRIEVLETKLDRLEKRPYHAPLRSQPKLKPLVCRCMRNMMGYRLGHAGSVYCRQCSRQLC